MKNIYRKTILTGAIGLFLGGIFSCSEEEPLNMAPTFQVNEATNIMRTSAVVSGSISGDIANISEYGFDYSLSEDFTSNLTTRQMVGESLSSNSYQLEIKGLEANERYYYRMYASTGASTVYSASNDFLTVASQAPVMSELVVDSIGEDMARFRCTIEEIGDEYLIEYGVGYKTSAERTYYQVPSDSIIPVSIAGAENTFFIEITGLESATKYSFRPYAKNSSDANGDTGTREGYGTIVERQTANKLSAVVKTIEIMDGNVGINSVTVSGMVVSADGSGGVIDKCGFCWSATNSTPSIVDSHIEVKPTGIGEYFTAIIADLQPGRTYYVRAYAQNTVGGSTQIGYGEIYEITTTNLKTPVLEWVVSKDEDGNDVEYQKVTPTSISVRANIKDYDASALVEKGVIWDKSRGQLSIEEARQNNTYMKIENGENMIDATIQNLTMDTQYYIRTYAIYQAAGLEEIGYSSTLSVRTQYFEKPNLDGMDIQNISYNSVELIGRIYSEGNGTILQRGFCLKSDTDTYTVTIDDCDIHEISDESFVTVVKGLKMNTLYSVNAYVISSLGTETDTIYSERHVFSTNDVGKPQWDWDWYNTETSATSYRASVIIGDLGDGEIVEQGFCWTFTNGVENIETNLENCTGSMVVDNGTHQGFSGTITGLYPSASYSIAAYMKMMVDEIEYVVYIHCGVVTNSINYDLSISDVTANSLKVTGHKTEEITEGITEYGFCWSTNEEHAVSEMPNQIKASMPNENGQFEAIITSLNQQTKYYVGIYIVYKGKKCFAEGRWEVNTLGMPNYNDNSSPEIKK